jgi:protein ImuA
VPLGVERLDAALGGGLPLAALHEIRAEESRDGGAAAGFALALAARIAAAGGEPALVWVSEADLRREAGRLYAPGLAALGLDPACIVEVAARTEGEALWAFEAALGCRGVGVAVCELRRASLDLTATRRAALRARDCGVTGLLLRLASAPEPSAAELRFGVAPAPAGTIGGFAAGIGRMAWRLALEKNRSGPTGAFSVEWTSHERRFVTPGGERGAAARGEGDAAAHPQPLPAAPFDRPADPASVDPAPVRRGGSRRYAS